MKFYPEDQRNNNSSDVITFEEVQKAIDSLPKMPEFPPAFAKKKDVEQFIEQHEMRWPSPNLWSQPTSFKVLHHHYLNDCCIVMGHREYAELCREADEVSVDVTHLAIIKAMRGSEFKIKDESEILLDMPLSGE